MRLLNAMAMFAVFVMALLVAPAPRAEVKDLGDPAQVIYFAADSDEVPAEAAKSLAGVQAAFKASGKTYLAIRGYSDPKEYPDPSYTAQYGVGLSQRRANNVRSLLWDRSLTDESSAFNGAMITEAHGESMPKQPGGSRRRVEIFFTNVSPF